MLELWLGYGAEVCYYEDERVVFRSTCVPARSFSTFILNGELGRIGANGGH